MRVTIVQSRHRKPYHPLSHHLQKHEAEVSREKEMPEAEASLRNSSDRRVNTSWKVLAPNCLGSIGILPNVNSLKLNRDVSSAQSAHSRTGRLKNSQTKSPRWVMTKVQLLLWRLYDSWVVYHRTLSRQILQRFLGRAQEYWNQLGEYDSRGLHCVKQTSEKEKVRLLGKYKSKSLISEVPTLWNLRTDLQEETARQEQCARGDAWELARKIFKLKKEVHLLRSGFCRPHPQ